MGGLDDFTSGAGYLQAVAYQLFVPLLFTRARSPANRAIAQPEEAGRWSSPSPCRSTGSGCSSTASPRSPWACSAWPP